jgi:hypothetical protein
MKRLLLLTLILSSFAVQTFGQSVVRKQYKATKIQVAPVINGILDDEAWNLGEWVDDFTQNEPYNGRPASQRTEFKILYDDNNLYVAFKAYDTSPDSIVNRLTRRDQEDGDRVGIIVDSFHDLRTGFLFGVSSTGVKFDQMYIDDGQIEDKSWDPNWWVKTSINKEGWVAEMKIPLSQVRFEKNSGDVWGLQMARVLYRKNETTFWQHIPKDAPGLIHLFGELTGLENIKPRKIFDVTPYGVARAETYKAEPANPFLASGKSTGLNGGIDAKIGVTNNMTMDLTINPDFGQVEADPSEVNLTAYETFFSEKRPFFIEGNNITNFNIGIGDGDSGSDNLFYSRRIGRRPQLELSLGDDEYSDIPTATRILGAAKLTGKSKKGLSVGFIESVTEPEYAELKKYIPSDLRYEKKYAEVEPLTNYFVGRVQKDFNNGKTLIGGMLTSTNRALDASLSDNMHKAAYTGGIDFTQYFKEKDWMFNLKTAFSEVTGSKKAITNTQESSARYFQRPDQKYAALDTNRTSLMGSGGRMQILKLNGHWNFMTSTTWKSPGFELNDIGFLREADQILSVLWAGYNQWEPKGIYRNYNINGDFYSFWNFGGNQLGKGFEWNASMNLKNFWSVWTGGAIRGNNLNTSLLRGGPTMKTPGDFSQRIGFSTDSRKKIVAEIYANYNGGFEKYTNSFDAGLDLTIKPSNYLSVTLSPGFSTSFNELQYVTKTTYGNDNRYIFASIDRKTISASFRVNINISPDLTLQYWGQPFIASGKYRNYKFITNPNAAKYNDRFLVYTNNQFISGPDELNIDENRDATPDYGYEKPDFNVQYFLSNLVLRWEYNPGSSVYLVWSQTRDSSNQTGNLDLMNDLGNLFDRSDSKPHNVFLVKFSYRFGLR